MPLVLHSVDLPAQPLLHQLLRLLLFALLNQPAEVVVALDRPVVSLQHVADQVVYGVAVLEFGG